MCSLNIPHSIQNLFFFFMLKAQYPSLENPSFGCLFIAELSWKKKFKKKYLCSLKKYKLFAEKVFLHGKKKFDIEKCFY